MFVLDTNVLSAMMLRHPAPEVAAWVAGQPIDVLFTTSICQAEVLAGIAVMREGSRRRDLEAAAQAMFSEDFEHRVLPFDMSAAASYAVIFAERRRMRRPAGTVDLMIAAIARSNGASVVTRNVADFEGCGVRVVDPWIGTRVAC